MNGIAIDIQYCDSTIRHDDGLRYSLIGIYPDTYPIPAAEYVLAQMDFNINLVISAQRQDLADTPLLIQTVKNGVPISSFHLPPLPTPAGDTFRGLIQQTVSHLSVAAGDTLNARLLAGTDILAEGNSLAFVHTAAG